MESKYDLINDIQKLNSKMTNKCYICDMNYASNKLGFPLLHDLYKLKSEYGWYYCDMNCGKKLFDAIFKLCEEYANKIQHKYRCLIISSNEKIIGNINVRNEHNEIENNWNAIGLCLVQNNELGFICIKKTKIIKLSFSEFRKLNENIFISL